MELEALARACQASMSSWSSSNGAPGRNMPSRVTTRLTCVSTGMSCIPKENSSTQAAVLRPTPGRRGELVARLGDGEVRKVVEADRRPAARGGSPGCARTSGDAGRRAGWPPRRPSRGASRTALPGREALAQPQVGDVAVAVVGRLRQDGEDQLVERAAVRRGERDAVDGPQAVADGDARGGGSGVQSRRGTVEVSQGRATVSARVSRFGADAGTNMPGGRRCWGRSASRALVACLR